MCTSQRMPIGYQQQQDVGSRRSLMSQNMLDGWAKLRVQPRAGVAFWNPEAGVALAGVAAEEAARPVGRVMPLAVVDLVLVHDARRRRVLLCDGRGVVPRCSGRLVAAYGSCYLTPSMRQTFRSRGFALATLVAFLVAQPVVGCLALCLLGTHHPATHAMAGMAPAGSSHVRHRRVSRRATSVRSNVTRPSRFLPWSLSHQRSSCLL